MTDNPPFVQKSKETCFLIVCRDGDNAVELREKHLDGHLAHVEQHWRRYITAGPLRDPGGDAIVGSAFLLLAPSLEDAKSALRDDPYVSCGMYATIEYKELTNSIGLFVGGKIWPSADAIRHRAAGGPSDEGADT